MSKKLEKLIILCGGTGGHFFPGLSVGRLFKERGGKPSLITGQHKSSYKKKYSSLYNLEIYEVSSGQISKNPFKLLLFFLKFTLGFIQSVKIYLKEKPDAILAMGSYTSIPSGMAALFMRIPIFLHDGNSVIGKANLFLSRWAKLVMVAFPPINKNIDSSKVTITGMPLRLELANSNIKDKKEALSVFNATFKKEFIKEKPTILIFGGSLGAKTINSIVPEAVRMYTVNGRETQIIHLTGKDNLNRILDAYKTIQADYLVLEKFDDMALFYRIADLVICRSGGSTVAELEFFNKHAILIPFPKASENHQYYNALYLTKKGKATIVEDKNCTAAILAEKITQLLNSQIKNQEEELIMANPAEKVLEKISSSL